MQKPLKDRIGKNIIAAIIDEYGGTMKYSYNDNFTDCILYDDKMDPGAVLSIDLRYNKENGSPYIEVRQSDNKGKNIRTDCYEVLFNGTELYKKSSAIKGKEIEYIDEKIAYVGPTKRKPRHELEKEFKDLQKQNKLLEEQNNRLLNKTEQEYLNSKTYILMSERISYLESLNRLNESALKDAETRVLKSAAEVKQIYEDNKRFLAHMGEKEYFIGITENWHAAWEYDKLSQEINRLKGSISGNDIIMIQKDNEIKKMLEKIAELKKELAELKNVPISDIVSSITDNETDEYVGTSISKEELEQAKKQIQERNKERIAEYKKRGRKPSTSKEDVALIIALRNEGYSIRDIARQVGYSIGWVHEIIIKVNTKY